MVNNTNILWSVKVCLECIGLGNLWFDPHISLNAFYNIKLRMRDIRVQEWDESLNKPSKSHSLAIETGKYLGIESSPKICRFCSLNV